MARTSSQIQLLNELGTVIDPATEDKQDDAIQELQYGTDRWFVEVSEGNVPNWTRRGVGGFNTDIDAGEEENISTVGGILTDLTANTLLYVSSTDAGDNDVVFVEALVDDGSGNTSRVTRFATLNGQNQVALNGNVIFVYQMFTATQPDGIIWLAQSDTLTNGVPNTQAKKICNIPLDDMGDSIAAGFTGKYQVPSGVSTYFAQLDLNVEKSKSVKFWYRVKAFGSFYRKQFPIIGYEQIPEYFTKGFSLPEKLTYDWVVYSNDDNTNVAFTNFVYEKTL